MLKAPDDATPERWQRYFAATANNRAWQLAELPPNEVDTRELLNAAHAAAWQWEAVGNELNHMRARMLLAQAHAMAGLGATALAYAQEMRSYFLAAPDTPDWERAFVHVVHARAAAAAGERAQHADAYREATSSVAAIASPQDRAIVERVFRHVPAP